MMKQLSLIAIIAIVAASSIGCRCGGRLAAMRDAWRTRHYDECMPCDDCGCDYGYEGGVIYESGPVYESAPASDGYIAPPSVTLPSPASYVSPST